MSNGVTEAAVLRIGLAQVGDVIHPALLRARSDVEVDALDGFERPDAVFTTFEDVMHRLGLLRPLPALAVLARLAPARAVVRSGRARVHGPPLGDLFRERRAPLEIDERVHRARVADLIVGNGGRIHRAGPGCEKICHSRLFSDIPRRDLRGAAV